MMASSSKSPYLLDVSYFSSTQKNTMMIAFHTRSSCRSMFLLKNPTSLLVNNSQCTSNSITQKTCGAIEKYEKQDKKAGKNEHHLWKHKDSSGSGHKAMNLVHIVSGLPNEKEVVYKALDKWIAWELEFPVIAAAKALRILQKKRQWRRVIQVAKWMLSKGQGTTMATYDAILLAYDQESRIEEAGSLWNMILHTHSRSISKRLFSRMIALYDHHDVLEKVIEVFADMEELGIKPDEDTVKRVARAFGKLGEEEKSKMVINRYGSKWKYIHFKGERVKVRRDPLG